MLKFNYNCFNNTQLKTQDYKSTIFYRNTQVSPKPIIHINIQNYKHIKRNRQHVQTLEYLKHNFTLNRDIFKTILNQQIETYIQKHNFPIKTKK